MFPINYNDPYTKNDGSVVPVGDVIGGGGSTLPTASTNVKGCVKIGSGLSMDGEVLNTDLPSYSIADAGKVLGVDETGKLAWVTVSGSSSRRAITKVPTLAPKTEAKEVAT